MGCLVTQEQAQGAYTQLLELNDEFMHMAPVSDHDPMRPHCDEVIYRASEWVDETAYEAPFVPTAEDLGKALIAAGTAWEAYVEQSALKLWRAKRLLKEIGA